MPAAAAPSPGPTEPRPSDPATTEHEAGAREARAHGRDRAATRVDLAASAPRYWPVPILRAVPAIALGVAITFSPDHSPRVGLLALGVAGVVGGLVLALGSLRRLDDPSSRTLGLVQGLVSLVVGALALAFSGGGLPVLVALVTTFALVTGALELVTGLRRRRRTPLARDWTTVGAMTLLLALAFLVVPPDYAEQLGGVEQIEGVLTSSTVLVGLLGAWGAVVGVYLVIAGLSLKWQTGADAATDAAPQTSADGVQHP